MSSPIAEMKKTLSIKPQQTMRGHNDRVRGAAHVPSRRRIITCSNDGSLRLWDTESGTQIGDDWRDDEDGAAVLTLALSPNGKTVASGNAVGKVTLWDVETGKVIAKWTGHTSIVWSVCWRQDGERLVSGSSDGTVRVWDVESGKTVLDLMKTGHKDVYAAIYSPDTTKIATGGDYEDGVKIWDAKTGELLFTIKHGRSVESLAWTSDQKKLITGSYASIRIFDTATWQEIAILDDYSCSYSLSLFQNDRLLASTSYDNTAHLWNLDTNLEVGPPLEHQDTVNSVAISADGKLLVTGCGDNSAYIWDIHTILKDAGLEDLLSIPDNSLQQNVADAKLLMDTAPRRRPARIRDARQLPQGFLDDSRDGVQYQFSATPRAHLPSSAHRNHTVTYSSRLHPRAVLGRLSSLFYYPQHNTHQATPLQPLPRRTILSRHRPPVVEVATAQDRRPLYVAPRPEGKGNQQQGQSQDQFQTSTSQTPPAAVSTSSTPPVVSVTTSGAGGTQSQSATTVKNPPWWARLVFFVCCASIQQPQ